MRPINPNKPTGLGVGVDTRPSNMHPSMRYKQNKEAELRKKILGSLPSIEQSTEDVVVDPFRSEGFDEFMQEKLDIFGSRKKAEEERLAAEEKIKEQIEEAKRKKEEREAFLDSPKGRMQTMWNDADKRDAILGGIADAMLETRVGADAYGNRFARASKNVRENLKLAEATDIARAKAALDMAKTQAETNKLLNPGQFMSDTQKEASDIASMEHAFGSQEWKDKYAAELRRIAYKDMMTGPVDAIIAINEYMMRAPIDETQKKVYTEIIEQLMTNIRSASGGEAPATSRSDTTIVGGADPGL